MERRGDRDEYRLTVDDQIAQLMDEVDSLARDMLEEDRRAPNSDLVDDDEIEEELEYRRRAVDMELDAISAARLAREAVS